MGLRDWVRLRDRVGPWGAEARAIGEVRRLAEAGRGEELLRFVADQGPGATRAARAAFASGALPTLRHALPAPAADEDVLLDTMARVRAGEPPHVARARLVARDARTLVTAFGVRAPARALAIPPLTARFELFLPDLLLPRAAAREALRARFVAQPDDPTTWLRLAALRHPDDAAPLAVARARSGRRADHVLLDAVSVHGTDALPALRAALHARDVDPGRGFTQRRIAADGLGRLGVHAALPLLLRALRDESADFEGRPGAGLGIQYPVRANLLWALGELGDPGAIPELVRMLGETSGSAFGGFYLPAMDALVRLGAVARAALELAARGQDEIVVANARGALAAISAGAPSGEATP